MQQRPCGTHQGMAFSSQWTNVPPRVLSLSLEVQGLFQGLMLGRLLGVCLSGAAAAPSGKHTQAHSRECVTVSSEISCQPAENKSLSSISGDCSRSEKRTSITCFSYGEILNSVILSSSAMNAWWGVILELKVNFILDLENGTLTNSLNKNYDKKSLIKSTC